MLHDNPRVSGPPRLRIKKNVCQTTKFGIYFVQKVVSSGEKCVKFCTRFAKLDKVCYLALENEQLLTL